MWAALLVTCSRFGFLKSKTLTGNLDSKEVENGTSRKSMLWTLSASLSVYGALVEVVSQWHLHRFWVMHSSRLASVKNKRSSLLALFVAR
jgi:hypothetical protein